MSLRQASGSERGEECVNARALPRCLEEATMLMMLQQHACDLTVQRYGERMLEFVASQKDVSRQAAEVQALSGLRRGKATPQ